MKKTISLSLIILLTCCPALNAEEPAGFNKEEFIASADSGRVLQLAMVDCIAMALKSNTEIKVKRIEPLIEDANIRIERARFEPDFTFDYLMDDSTEKSSSLLSEPRISKAKVNTFDFGYAQKLVTGTDIELDFYNTRTSSNSRLQATNPIYDSKAEVTVTQPLLKGFGIVVNKADFLIAKNNKLISNQDLATEIIKVLTNVKKGYYELQYSREQYEVAETSLKRVNDLYNINKEKYAKGLASNIDVVEAEAEVARMEEALLASERLSYDAEDNLKLITNLVDDAAFWNAHIVLLEEPGYEKHEPKLIDSILRAFEHRPDYEAMKIDLKNKDLSVVYYRNGILPTVDLVGSYGLNGLDKAYDRDLGDIRKADYQDWSVGIKVSLPLGSDEEKGNYEKSKYDKKQALLKFKRLEQNIILEVRDAVRYVDTKYKMLEASKKSKEAETENYAAQEERFKVGLVSTLDMVTYQERLARAELNYARSVIDYNIALIELAKAEGMTLVNDNINIE